MNILKVTGLIFAVLLVNIIGGYFIGTKVIIPMLYKPDAMFETTEVKEEGVSQDVTTPGLTKALDSINLNPRNSSGEFFSIDIVFETQDEAVIAELNERNFEVLDKISTYLSYKTVDELNDPSNWEKYRKEMIAILNKMLRNGTITYIHIPQKIIQFP